MKLESVELQEPAEEWMYRKSEPPYQIGDEAYPLPFVGTWGSLRLLPTLVGGQPSSDRTMKAGGRYPPAWSFTSSLCGTEHLLQSPGKGLGAREEEPR